MVCNVVVTHTHKDTLSSAALDCGPRDLTHLTMS
jgi:hypothetical protein